MKYKDKNYNEIIISGIINNITDTNDKYIKFSMTTYIPHLKKNTYMGLNIDRNLYNIYKDLFVKGEKIFVKGYLNSYIDKNIFKNFISVTDVSDNPTDIFKGRAYPHIRYDPDGVMVWNGKRCEKQPLTEDELNEMKELLKEYM